MSMNDVREMLRKDLVKEEDRLAKAELAVPKTVAIQMKAAEREKRASARFKVAQAELQAAIKANNDAANAASRAEIDLETAIAMHRYAKRQIEKWADANGTEIDD